MCLVLDTNTFSYMFPGNALHNEYKPILLWVKNDDGFFVYGGSRYKNELFRTRRFLSLFTELRRGGKVKEVNGALVDRHQKIVEEKVRKRGFNDGHLIAIFRVSKCKILCSNDRKSFEHIKNSTLYLKGQNPPVIYTGKRNRDLLCRKNIVKIKNAWIIDGVRSCVLLVGG